MVDIDNIRTIEDLNNIDLGQFSLKELERIYTKIKDTIPPRMILATSDGIICYPKDKDSDDAESSSPHKRMTAKKHRNQKWRNGKKK